MKLRKYSTPFCEVQFLKAEDGVLLTESNGTETHDPFAPARNPLYV